MDFEQTRRAPETTAEVTAQIERLILRRVKDQVWDDVERKVKSSKASPRPAAASKSDPNTKEAERRLEEILGTVVKIRRRKKGQGRLEIDFHSEEELHRIYETIQHGTRNAKRPAR